MIKHTLDNRLDLEQEQERRWTYICAGREHNYHGTAVYWQHLSAWERFRGVHKDYDAEIDYRQQHEEVRGD